MTKEKVGTPEKNPQFVCFVNAKSTRARTGIVVHFTAPTINAGWSGQVALEIANFGPFDFVLKAGDVVAQLTVGTLSSTPDHSLAARSTTKGQTHASGDSGKLKTTPAKRRPRNG